MLKYVIGHMGKMGKSLSYFIFGILVLAIVPNSVTPSYAQPILFGESHQGGGLSTLLQINPATGAATPIGPINFNACGSMDFHPTTGVLFAACNDPASGLQVLVTVNTSTGAGTLVGPLVNTLFGNFDMSFRSDGTLFLGSFDNVVAVVSLFTVNTNTGLATLVGFIEPFASGNALSFQAGTLFHASGFNLILNTINQATGVPTPVAALSFAGFPPQQLFFRTNAMDSNPSTGIMFAAVNDGQGGNGPNYLATLNTVTGVVTHIGQSQNGLDGLAWQPDLQQPIGGTFVPIDTTALLLVSIQSISMWMIPVVAAGIVIGVFVIKRRK